MRAVVCIALAPLLASLLFACKGGEQQATPVPSAKPAATPVASPASAAPVPPAPPPEAPFTVMLDAPDTAPAHGAVTLKANIDASKEFKASTTITVEVPPGAKLVSGKKSEVIDPLPSGRTTRSFTVSSAKQLTNENPVKIVVEAHDPSGSFGARAERVFPQK